MIYIILSLSIISSLVFSYFLFSQRQQLIALQEKASTLEKQNNRTAKDQSALINADLVFTRQFNEINRQLVSMDNQLQELENKRGNDGGYQHALRILEMGGDKEEIIKNCHLSNAEAELLMNLQAYRLALKLS